MPSALKTLQANLSSRDSQIVISGGQLSSELVSELRGLVSLILKQTAIGRIGEPGAESTSGVIIPDLPGFSLSALSNEPWITDTILVALLFAWSADKDIRYLGDPENSPVSRSDR